jgi:hypothetical protein
MRRLTARQGPGFIQGAVAAVAMVVWVAMSIIGDRMAKASATTEAKARFAALEAAMAARLRQPGPLELGAVWATHDGRICGLVNGQNSFGGKAGMIPFFTDGGAVRYTLDTDPELFAQGWTDCVGDMWAEIVKGSTTQGFCATREGALHCRWTSERRPE